MRSTALQNAKSVLEIRRKADEELRATQEALRKSTDRANQVFESISDGFMIVDRDWCVTFMNRRAEANIAHSGRTRDEIIGLTLWEAFPELVGSDLERQHRESMKSGQPSQFEYHYPITKNWFEVRDYPSADGLSIYFQDISGRKQAEAYLAAERKILEEIATGQPLEQVLTTIACEVETQSSEGLLCSILIFDADHKRLLHGAAPSLPEAYNVAINGVSIGPSVGSCGTAAFKKEPVEVHDIATDPLWADYKDLAKKHGLASCTSTPIISSQGQLLGTIAMYYKRVGTPSESDRLLILQANHLAGIVIERHQAEETLREESRVLEVLNKTGEAIAGELDIHALVQTVTDAATELSGAEFGAFFYNVIDQEGESFLLYTLSGAPREAFEKFGLPRNTPIFAPTFTGERIVRLEDVTADPNYGTMEPHHGMPKGHLPVRSYLAVPVISRSGEVIGGLFFGHSAVGVFTEKSERIVAGMAAQAAIGIDNARLYDSAQAEIRERTKTQEALRKSEQHLRATFTQAAVGIAVAELDGRFSEVNPKFAEITGYSPEELEKMTYTQLTHPDDLGDTQTQMKRLIDREVTDFVYEKRYIRKDGSPVWCLITVTMLTDEDGNPLRFVGVIEDITIQKTTEQEKLQALESERAARLEAEKLSRLKDEFLATLSHELRTPLNAVLGWTHLISRDLDNKKLISEGIEVIDRNAKVQTQLVSDLLEMSRIISGKMRLDVQQVQLPVVVEAAIDSVRPAADAKGVRIETVLDPISDPVYGDPSRLQQVVWNLLSNAVKFTARGGKVQVFLKRVNSHVEVVVADTGRGIKPEFLPHLFERFRQEDATAAREHGGLGIGLALVKQLVDLHGGRVRAESPGEGKGSKFTIEIPVSVVKTAAEIAVDRRHPTSEIDARDNDLVPDLKGLKILVVDDEPDARNLLKRILDEHGAVVETAGSAAEGLTKLHDHKPDVLISDIGMPGRDGYDFIREIRATGNQVPAAALTAFARSEDRTRALMAGFQSHLAKPVDPTELLATVASLAKRTSMR